MLSTIGYPYCRSSAYAHANYLNCYLVKYDISYQI